MFKKNNFDFQGGLMPLSDMLVSDSSVPNEQEAKQEAYYPSINDPDFYNSIYQEQPADNLNNYYKSYTISDNQANNLEAIGTSDQSQRVTMFHTTNNNQINKEINKKENISIQNNETTQKSQSEAVIHVDKNINANPEKIILRRSVVRSLKSLKSFKKTDTINDNANDNVHSNINVNNNINVNDNKNDNKNSTVNVNNNVNVNENKNDNKNNNKDANVNVNNNVNVNDNKNDSKNENKNDNKNENKNNNKNDNNNDNKNDNKNDKNINNNNLVNNKKYILKYLLLKKKTKLNVLLKTKFGKYKKNAIEQKDIKANTESSENLKTNENKEKNENNGSNESNDKLKIKKLRDIVRKKISKNREVMHIVFIKYYYSSLYIHLNWYMYVLNQLTYQQSLNPNNQTSYYGATTNNQDTSNAEDNNASEDPDPFQNIPPAEDSNTRHNSEVNNAFRQSLMSIKKINNSDNMEQAFRESIMTINRLNDALNNEEKEKKKLEKKKQLKDLVLRRFKEIKNDFHKLFTKFYYQGLLAEKSKQNEESKHENNEEDAITEGAPTRLRAKKNPAIERRNKARNLRKLMIKKEKEKGELLRKYFYKFYTNGMLCKLKKNAKYSHSSKNVRFNMDVKFYENGENQEENQELTLLDKKRIEDQRKKDELNLKRISALKIIFFKKDRHITIIKKQTIEKWNLRAKLMSLEGFKKGKKKDLTKSVRIKKKKSKHTKGTLDFKKGAKSQVIIDKMVDDEFDLNQDNNN